MNEIIDPPKFLRHRLNNIFDRLSVRRVELEGLDLVVGVDGMFFALLGSSLDTSFVDVREGDCSGTSGGEGVCGTLANASC